MTAKNTKGRDSKGRRKEGAKGSYFSNNNAKGNRTKKSTTAGYKGNNNARKSK